MMKEMSKRIAVLALFFALCAAGCREPGTSSENPVPSVELTEAELLAAFSLVKGNMTASAAAKKVENAASPSGMTFTGREIVAYDDEAGTFTVKVKGTKDGKNFSQKISVTGFTHPLAGKTIQSLDDCELNLDEGIEHNYSLTKYIAEVNKDPSGAKLVKKLSFMLSGGTTIELGEHDTYTLAATATKKTVSGTEKVKVNQIFEIVYRKKTENSTGETTTKKKDTAIYNFPDLEKDYFTAADVFKYVLDKTADIAIKVDANEFASSFYALAKNGSSAGDLFTEEFKANVKKYTDLYQTKGTDEHLALDISYGISQPKSGGLEADDYTGTVTVDLCIATNQQIADQNGITAIKHIEKSGFASIPDDVALAKKDYLFFNLIPKSSLNDALKTQWEQKVFFPPYSLLRVNENGQSTVNNPFTASDIPFHLCVNSENTNPSVHLGCAIFGASKTRNEKIIWIENIYLQKAANSKSMEVQIKLKGSLSSPVLKVTIEPY